MELSITCSMCHFRHVLTVAQSDYNKWQAGALVQDAFSNLTVGERELLVSKTCEPCFDDMFSEEALDANRMA